MMYQKTAFQGFVAGGKGQGKSTLVSNLTRGRSRIFAFDFLGEYARSGFVVVRTLADFHRETAKRWKRGFKIAYQPTKPWRDEKRKLHNSYPEQLSKLADLICQFQMPYYETPDLGKVPPIPKVLLVVEEMAFSFPVQCAFDGMQNVTILGRHYGVDCIGTTQRCNNVDVDFRGTSDLRFFFAQTEAVDVKVICEMIGRQHRAALTSLKPHEYLRLYQGQVTRGKNPLKR